MKVIGIACHAIPWIWSNHGLEDLLEDIANLGFDGIELPSELFLSAERSWSSIRQKLEERDIRIIAVYQTARLGNKDDCVQHYEFRRCDALLDLMHFLEIWYLVIGDPPINYGDDHLVLARALEKLGAIAKSKGITLCYHPHRGSITETPEQIDRLMQITSPDTVSLCLDTGHIFWGGGAPSQVLREFRSRVAYIHFKDVRTKPLSSIEKLVEIVKSVGTRVDGRVKLKTLGSMLMETKGPIITEIGRGDIDFRAVIEELNNINYEGWITIELDTPTLSPKQSVERCVSRVKELFRLAGSERT